MEYRMASLQYTDRLTIHTRHTTNEGKKPISNTSAQIASTMARIAQTVLVARYALYAHLPIMIFSASSQSYIHFFWNRIS